MLRRLDLVTHTKSTLTGWQLTSRQRRLEDGGGVAVGGVESVGVQAPRSRRATEGD